jgi:hypothetical protein
VARTIARMDDPGWPRFAAACQALAGVARLDDAAIADAWEAYDAGLTPAHWACATGACPAIAPDPCVSPWTEGHVRPQGHGVPLAFSESALLLAVAGWPLPDDLDPEPYARPNAARRPWWLTAGLAFGSTLAGAAVALMLVQVP